MSLVKYIFVAPVVALAFLSTAVAGQKDSKSEPTQVRVTEDKMAGKEDMGDQSRIICRKIKETGSRLVSKRVCATAAEWAAQKQQNREAIERSQNGRYKNN